MYLCIYRSIYRSIDPSIYLPIYRSIYLPIYLSNRYVTTLHAIVSGIRKLARVEPIPEGRCVYRGLGGMLLPKAFHDKNELGCMGGVERAFMSTTTKREIAVQYSGKKTPTIFQISIGQIDMGASLNVLSQYAGEEEILMPPLSNLEVVGAHVTNCSRWKRTYAPGVGFDCVGCRVANTTITHSPHAALQGGGSLNVFEHNLVSHAVYGSIDAGAFYVGRSWAMRGNVVRFNRFEHVRPTERLAQASCSQNAFYLDDQMSGYEFYGNTVVNATTGVLLGGGRDNRIHGNTFVGCDTDVAFDDRGLNWQAKSCQRNCTAA